MNKKMTPSSTFSRCSNFLILFAPFVIDEGKIGLWSNPSVFRSLAAAQGYDSGRLINRWIGRRRYPGIIWETEGEGNIYLNSNYPHLRRLMLLWGQLSAGWASTLHFKHSSALWGHPSLGRGVHILKMCPPESHLSSPLIFFFKAGRKVHLIGGQRSPSLNGEGIFVAHRLCSLTVERYLWDFSVILANKPQNNQCYGCSFL